MGRGLGALTHSALGRLSEVTCVLMGPIMQRPTVLTVVLLRVFETTQIPVECMVGCLFRSTSRMYLSVELVCRLNRLGRNLMVKMVLLSVGSLLQAILIRGLSKMAGM